MINLTSSKLKPVLQRKIKGKEKERHRQGESNHNASIWHKNLYLKHIKNLQIDTKKTKILKNRQNICTDTSQKRK